MPSKALTILKASKQKINILREKWATDIIHENKNTVVYYGSWNRKHNWLLNIYFLKYNSTSNQRNARWNSNMIPFAVYQVNTLWKNLKHPIFLWKEAQQLLSSFFLC